MDISLGALLLPWLLLGKVLHVPHVRKLSEVAWYALQVSLVKQLHKKLTNMQLF